MIIEIKERERFCLSGILSGRNFVQKGHYLGAILGEGFCPGGTLSGRDFVLHNIKVYVASYYLPTAPGG